MLVSTDSGIPQGSLRFHSLLIVFEVDSGCVYIPVVPLPEFSSRPLGLWTQVSTHVQYIVSNIDLVFGLSVLDPCVSYCPSGICRCWPCEPTEDIRISSPFYISSSCARCPAPKLFGSMNINDSCNKRNNKDISMATVSVHQGSSTISRI